MARSEVRPAIARRKLKETFPCVVGGRLPNVFDQTLHPIVRAHLSRRPISGRLLDELYSEGSGRRHLPLLPVFGAQQPVLNIGLFQVGRLHTSGRARASQLDAMLETWINTGSVILCIVRREGETVSVIDTHFHRHLAILVYLRCLPTVT